MKNTVWIDWITGEPVTRRDPNSLRTRYFEARPTGSDTIDVAVWKCGTHLIAVPYSDGSADKAAITACGFDPAKAVLVCKGYRNDTWKGIIGCLENKKH